MHVGVGEFRRLVILFQPLVLKGFCASIAALLFTLYMATYWYDRRTMFSTCAWSSFPCALCACAHFGIVTTVVIAASETERRKSRFVNIFGTPSNLELCSSARTLLPDHLSSRCYAPPRPLTMQNRPIRRPPGCPLAHIGSKETGVGRPLAGWKRTFALGEPEQKFFRLRLLSIIYPPHRPFRDGTILDRPGGVGRSDNFSMSNPSRRESLEVEMLAQPPSSFRRSPVPRRQGGVGPQRKFFDADIVNSIPPSSSVGVPFRARRGSMQFGWLPRPSQPSRAQVGGVYGDPRASFWLRICKRTANDRQTGLLQDNITRSSHSRRVQPQE